MHKYFINSHLDGTVVSLKMEAYLQKYTQNLIQNRQSCPKTLISKLENHQTNYKAKIQQRDTSGRLLNLKKQNNKIKRSYEYNVTS